MLRMSLYRLLQRCYDLTIGNGQVNKQACSVIILSTAHPTATTATIRRKLQYLTGEHRVRLILLSEMRSL